MALQKSFDDQYGSTHASAYHRIVFAKINHQMKTAHVIVGIYVDAAARSADKTPVAQRTYDYGGDFFDAIFAASAMDTKNYLAGLYDDIKAKDEYSGATDV